jgi:hypothetical protein
VNKFVKILALVLALVLSMSVLAACSDTEATKPTTKPDATKPSTMPAVEKDLIGIVKEISSSFVVLETYVSELDVVNYEKLNLENLKLTGEKDYVFISATASYGHFTDGKLTDLKKADLKVGDIIVVTKTAKGAQQIVIMNYKTATTEPTNPSQPTTPAN